MRHTQIESVIKKGIVFSWSNSIAAIPFTNGQTINFYSGHQPFLRFGPTWTFPTIILMTWDKQKSNKRKKKQCDFYADIVMELLDELKYLQLVWRFIEVLLLLELFLQ